MVTLQIREKKQMTPRHRHIIDSVLVHDGRSGTGGIDMHHVFYQSGIENITADQSGKREEKSDHQSIFTILPTAKIDEILLISIFLVFLSIRMHLKHKFGLPAIPVREGAETLRSAVRCKRQNACGHRCRNHYGGKPVSAESERLQLPLRQCSRPTKAASAIYEALHLKPALFRKI